jgi:hypothetical protein
MAQVDIAWEENVTDLAGATAPAGSDAPLPIVPSSLRADDPALARLREAWRRAGCRSSVLTPRHTASALARRGGGSWRSVAAAGSVFRLDSRLAHRSWLALTRVDASSARGPFVLDLPSRFLHPADRLRLLARGDRHRTLADIASAALPASSVVLSPLCDGWLAVRTLDPIAAELWALALAERFLDQRLEMQGPWEDATVQRATELELGLQIPGQMSVTLATTYLPPDGVHILAQAALRLGLRLPAR